MGYWASGSGRVAFKKGTAEETVEKARKAFSDAGYFSHPNEVAYLNVVLDFEDKYYEEDLYDVLYSILPDLDGAFFEFNGEDGLHWRIFTENGRLVERTGEIVYGLEDMFARADIEYIVDALSKMNPSPQREKLLERFKKGCAA